ncbi:MAG TPA: hypothetical protein VGJ93_05740 [Desulfuromonadaceae bacterium]|jgi:hypothetical protein
MRYRRFVLFLIVTVASFVAINFTVWTLITEELITNKKSDGGDLARMGYLPDSKTERKNMTDLPRRHMDLNNYGGRHFDILTIGDSFSNGGGGGYNRFYQDYIASSYNFEVLNVHPYAGLDFISTIAILLNNGFLKQAKPRYVLLGATEIGWKEWSHQIDFERNPTMTDLEKYPERMTGSKPPHISFINNGNFKYLLFKCFYRFSDNALFSKVYKAKLTKRFFSVPEGDRLLYLPYRHVPSAGDVEQVNKNLNELSDRLNACGIRLIFMPFPDKYTLYARWLEKKRFPESSFFEYLRPLPKHYLFVDSKKLLQEALEQGEKDIYYADDTHSSWKASRILINNTNLNQ